MNKLDSNLKYKECCFTPDLYHKYEDTCVLMLHDKVITSFKYLHNSKKDQGFCLYILEDEDFVGQYSLWKVKILIPVKVKRIPFCPNIPNDGIYYSYGQNYESKVSEYHIFSSDAVAIILENGHRVFTYAIYLSMDVLDYE